MHSRSFWLLLAGVAAALLTHPLSGLALTVTLIEIDPTTPSLVTHLESRAVSYCCGEEVRAFDPTILPLNDAHRSEVDRVVSETAYSLDDSGFMIDIIGQSRHERSNAISSGAIYFTVDQDVDYALSGRYAMIGNRDIVLEVMLTNLSNGGTFPLLFDNLQESAQTQDESFQLGSAEGDRHMDRLSGSLSGRLIADTPYRLMYRATIFSAESQTDQASASGFIHLALIPEPSTTLMLTSGLVVLAKIRRRQAGSHSA